MRSRISPDTFYVIRTFPSTNLDRLILKNSTPTIFSNAEAFKTSIISGQSKIERERERERERARERERKRRNRTISEVRKN